MSRGIPRTPRFAACIVLTATSSVGLCITGDAAGRDTVSPLQAIEQATFARLGAGVTRVDVDSLMTTVGAQPALVAVPDPAGLVGGTVRFALTVDGKRRGVALASVRVRARVARVVKPIERENLIDAAAVTVVDEDVSGVRFNRLPQLVDVIGARARRDLAPGVMLTSGMVVSPPAVVHGDRITVGVTVGRVHVSAEGVASGSGQVGDVVRVMQPGRRTMLKARVVERGVVEVLP